MEEIIFRSDDLLVMNLINYFITEQNYNPMIIHGVNDEIWLENLNSDYKIIRIISHHIHNKEQLNFDKFKLDKIVLARPRGLCPDTKFPSEYITKVSPT